MNNRIFIVILLGCLMTPLAADQLILNKRAAKVGNEVILISDVEKFSRLYQKSAEESLNYLIEDALLYLGAKISTDAPEETQVEAQIKDDKAYYASRLGVPVSKVSDSEFLSALLMNNLSMTTYKDYIRKKLWITKYITEKIENEKVKRYYPPKEKIEELIQTKPHLFEEKEGIILSMIYLSYFNPDNTRKTEEQILVQKKKAENCLAEYKSGKTFTDLVNIYSDDLVSINTVPKGRVGFIAFDDSRSVVAFSEAIINDLKTAPEGPLYKLYETGNGLYLFLVDKRVKAKKLDPAEAMVKAEGMLVNEFELNLRNKVRSKLISQLRTQFEVKIY